MKVRVDRYYLSYLWFVRGSLLSSQWNVTKYTHASTLLFCLPSDRIYPGKRIGAKEVQPKQAASSSHVANAIFVNINRCC